MNRTRTIRNRIAAVVVGVAAAGALILGAVSLSSSAPPDPNWGSQVLSGTSEPPAADPEATPNDTNWG
ncbi:hypothetical protein [Streptomyces alboflavus]|uniref:hypothetical protein n=1 Tax=Streptomyces alboflavus TaxID=67267 RepID=UPI0013312031|nr:hypothetical protein [Streptomyces alboflavus]